MIARTNRSYMRRVANGYRLSAEYHEYKARMASAEGDTRDAMMDRQRACEYRKRARQLEVELEDAA